MSAIPAISRPVGRGRNGLPFLQIVGPRGSAKVLAVAAALESLLAGDPLTAPSTPDIVRLKAAPKLKEPEFPRLRLGCLPGQDVVFSSKADHKRGETI